MKKRRNQRVSRWPLRKRFSRIAMLPEEMRLEINRKMRDGQQIKMIGEWLFEQRADRDLPHLHLKAGDAYSLSWLRTSPKEKNARRTVEAGLARWFYTSYQEWLRREQAREETVQRVEDSEQTNRAAAEKSQPDADVGGNLIIRSMLLEAINLVHKDSKDPTELSQLATAWARLKQTAIELEKLRLRTQEAVDAGLKALKSEITKDPEAIELFKKLHDIVKRSANSDA
ncbi:MAG TPA: hypothetical protein VNL17_08590 [Verrucomicrobiae bacterium]|nr:hypothetical protein [Verrucomicrobiae bacterium]